MNIYEDKELVYCNDDADYPFAFRTNEDFTVGYIRFLLIKNGFLQGDNPVLLFHGSALDLKRTFKQCRLKENSVIVCQDS